ncbi:MAG: hypothetical protein AAFP19_13820 [Bacteroidota bacterium]
MTIGLIELYDHSEVLRVLCQLLDHPRFQLKVFTTRPIYQDQYTLHEQQNITWQLMERHQSPKSFFRENLSQVNSCDQLIFTTWLPDRPFVQNHSLHPPKLLLLHNGHTFFAPNEHLQLQIWGKGKLRDMARWMRYHWRGGAEATKRILDTFDYLCFTESHIAKYMKAHFEPALRPHRFIAPLPLSFFSPPKKIEKKVLTIVIPGVIREQGKDYLTLLRAFQKSWPRLKNPFRLVFLGNAQSTFAQSLLRRFEQEKGPQVELISFAQFIPQKTFDHWLQQADFLLLPIAPTLRLNLIVEYYGRSNISGGINDMIRWGTPALVPTFYPLNPTLTQLVGRYEGVEALSDLLVDWINNGRYEDKRAAAIEGLKEYLFEQQQKVLIRLLGEAFK